MFLKQIGKGVRFVIFLLLIRPKAGGNGRSVRRLHVIHACRVGSLLVRIITTAAHHCHATKTAHGLLLHIAKASSSHGVVVVAHSHGRHLLLHHHHLHLLLLHGCHVVAVVRELKATVLIHSIAHHHARRIVLVHKLKATIATTTTAARHGHHAIHAANEIAALSRRTPHDWFLDRR